ncbi:anthranilate 1,2-dioxygenase [Sphingobium indicum]|uniref:Anthranilate 1,2-dioxygenase n=1 Tax=Sphingobium indicum TaxID=332055 RepID=A0A4Q4JAT0_9SPHN|nr:nuclear transport factor 2 family protein [Sphingobium indicum]NYI21947.1 anthranilate 1,2-dioxygenase small subunit [Sphingobium indicum]RYM03295.1 anthranilate 1,2-dioxygenase [Sphingobium indicum]
MNETMMLRLDMLDLLDRYVEAIDNDRLEEWPDFFAEECLYEIIPKENEDHGFVAPIIRCESRGMLRDRITSLRHANIFAPAIYRHFTSGLRLTEVSAEEVSFTASYLVINSNQAGQSLVYQAGRYAARLGCYGAEWKFTSLRCIYDTSRVQTLLALPI